MKKLKPVKLAPALIAVCVIVLVCLLRLLKLDFFERLERMTYDMRVRQALKFPAPIATNLGFVCIDDASIDFVKTNGLPGNPLIGYRFGLYWPRQVYGRLVEELAAQKAEAVAFDVIFGERRLDHPQVQMADGSLMESDDFLAERMRRAGNVVIAVTPEVKLPALFATNALAWGDISVDKDSDGILRRVKAFRMYRRWHPAFRQVEEDPDLGVDLREARIEPKQIVLPRANAREGEQKEFIVPLDDDGNFKLADFGGDKLPPGVPPTARPFTDERVWHMGIVLAARQLGLDLAKADVELARGKIVLRGAGGVERIVPVDRDGYFYIDWALPPNDRRLFQEPIENLLLQDRWRLDGTNDLPNRWAGKLVVVGSSATGNDLTDRGATPIRADTLLVSKHWNVANSILTGRFIRRSSLGMDLLLITMMGLLAGFITWQLRTLVASGMMVFLIVVYVLLGVFLYVQYRYWLPLVLPVGVAQLMTYVCLMAWNVMFEQAEQRRVKSIFSRIVSPNIVHELLQAKQLSLGGARREVTVLFADVRGFTEFTDMSQEKAAAYVSEHKLSGEAVEAFFDEQARETLSTVNTYLALVADMVKQQDGTLDKYIGDCVMAFWGAPTPNPQHALACVRAAIDAQRAVYDLNRKRAEQNRSLELENLARLSAGLTPKPLQPILLLGTGINTGMATVGLMGSQAHLSNYTVFGRDVNLASRLESLSGRGRILISETTHAHLLRSDAALAATCVALPDLQKLKGFGAAMKVYEVPWRPPGVAPFDEEFPERATGDPAASTNFIKRDNL